MEKKGDSRGKMLLVASRLSDLAPPFLDGAPLPCARPLRTPVGIYALAPPVLPRDPVPPPNIRSTYASRSMLSSPFDRSWRVKFHLADLVLEGQKAIWDLFKIEVGHDLT